MDLARATKSLHNRLFVARCLARGALLKLAYGPGLDAGPGLFVGRDVELAVYGTLRLGRDVKLSSGCALQVSPGAELVLEDGVFVGRHTVIAAAGSIRIGAHTEIAEHCSIRDSDHDLDAAARRAGKSNVTAVEIADHVWIGAGVRVLRGSRLGPRVVVGANAVVREAFDEGSVLAGVPARVIRRL